MDYKRKNFDSAFLNRLFGSLQPNLPAGWATEGGFSDEVGFELVGSDSVNSIRRIEWVIQRFEFLAEV
ncbi:hypothetical protein CEXT_799981 [Caerostris extrusa]|uniref:Uncharacterized protein n=1 Tax=Caerostris extrusa TaxID=172846 RepID=A0AAV4RI66_CAEEX|nr:hypothetical protein CEXT_799981 [Caerostris extrusa]